MKLQKIFEQIRTSKIHVFSVLLGSLLGVICLAVGAIYLWMNTLRVFDISSKQFENLNHFKFKDNTVIYDDSDQKISDVFTDYQIYVPYNEIPQKLIDAVISIEDKRYWDHHGVDFKAMFRAAYARVRRQRIIQGGSTITQQLVRQIYFTREKTLERKVQEIFYAHELEKVVSKKKILEIYLNTSFLGNGTYGVAAAAQKYFSKPLKELKPHQFAVIAALFQSPSRVNPIANFQLTRQRQRLVLNAMLQGKYLSEDQYAQAIKASIRIKVSKVESNKFAGYFTDYIKQKAEEILNVASLDGRGLRIYTTLNSAMQRKLEQTNKTMIPHFAKYETTYSQGSKLNLESATLVTNPVTGDVLAMQGGRDYEKSMFNRTISSKRSPGSAFKPIVYTAALQYGMKWNDVIYVSPVNINNYRPKNFSQEYLTETTMIRAFYKSLNSPTVEIAQKIGLSPIIDLAQNLGIESTLKNEFGTVLGSSDVTMLDLARIYGVFANQGVKVDVNPITKITDYKGNTLFERPSIQHRSKKVLNAQIAFLMHEAMKQVLKIGTAASSSDLSKFAAGKTGTSNDSTDNWFCGYTKNLVVITWVGTDDHKPMFGNTTGSSLALPIWDHYIREVYKDYPITNFQEPQGVQFVSINPDTGRRSTNGLRVPFLLSTLPKDEGYVSEKGEENRNVFKK